MALTKVLITVKTYPTISSKYDELVCTTVFILTNKIHVARNFQKLRTIKMEA